MKSIPIRTIVSILDGVSTADEYFARAKDLGYKGLTLTDHSTNAGHRAWYRAAEKYDLIPGLGCEIHYRPNRFEKPTEAKRQDGESTKSWYHLILIAKNDNGLKNLYKIEERANTESFHGKPIVDADLLAEYRDDLICTTSCVSGPVAANLILETNEGDDAARNHFEKLFNIFGEDFYVEIQDHNEGISSGLNKKLLSLANEYGVKAIMAQDAHHADPKDLWLQDAMLIINTNPKKAKDLSLLNFVDQEIVMKTYNLKKVMDITYEMIEILLPTQFVEFIENGIWTLDKLKIIPNMEVIQDMPWEVMFNAMYPGRSMTFEHAEVCLLPIQDRVDRFLDQDIDPFPLINNTIEIMEKVK